MARPGATLFFLALLALLAGCATPAADLARSDLRVPPAPACAEPCLRAVEDGPARAWEPSVAVDPRDPDHVLVGHAVWERDAATGLATSWLVGHVSFDGGATWETTRLPGGPSAGAGHPLATANAMGDAVVAFLPDGTALFSGLAFDHAGMGARADAYTAVSPARPLDVLLRNDVDASARTAYAVFVARSGDGGRSWGEVSVVREGRGALALAVTPAGSLGLAAAWDANDKQWLAVGPDGTLLLAWGRLLFLAPPEEPVSRQDIVASVSRDGGRTWTEPALVERGGDWLGVSAAVAPDGAMHLAYVDLFTHDLHVAASRDGGATWDARRVGESASFPSLAVQPTPGGHRLLLAHAGKLQGARHVLEQDQRPQRPQVVWSDDGGRTWSAPLVLDEPEAPGRTIPLVMVAGDGTPVASWFHARETGAELRVVALRDGARGEALTLDAPRAPANLLGDYVGLAPAPDGAVLAWVTTEDGKGFDVAMARVVLPG